LLASGLDFGGDMYPCMHATLKRTPFECGSWNQKSRICRSKKLGYNYVWVME